MSPTISSLCLQATQLERNAGEMNLVEGLQKVIKIREAILQDPILMLGTAPLQQKLEVLQSHFQKRLENVTKTIQAMSAITV